MPDPRDAQGISLAALESALSEPRLNAYRLDADEPVEAVIGRYRWNIALSMSFYPALHLLEVTLRNNLHRVMSAHHGTSAWYELTPPVLTPGDQGTIMKAKGELKKQQKPEEPGRLVAELSFGFWTSLLGTGYEQKLWPRLLGAVFPHMPRRQRTRSNVARRFHHIRHLRNRVSHHEPIYKLKNLAQRYGEIQEALGWLSPTPLHLLPIGADFRDVHTHGSALYEIRRT
jgi:hypothetical protein